MQKGEIDPSFVITHRMSLEEAPEAYRMFRDKQDRCIKVVLKPGQRGNGAAVGNGASVGNGRGPT